MENSYSNRTAIASAFDLLSTRGGLNVYIRNRVVCRKIDLQSSWLHRLKKYCLVSGMTCDSSQDGGWALVRRIVHGSQWFAGTDKLTGMAHWSDPSNGEFYTRYSHLLNPQTEFMFATGTRCNNTPFVDLRHCADFHSCSVDGSKWLITTFASITNNGNAYRKGFATTDVIKSSASDKPCM
jgi:hypothetical protein